MRSAFPNAKCPVRDLIAICSISRARTIFINIKYFEILLVQKHTVKIAKIPALLKYSEYLVIILEYITTIISELQNKWY